MGLKRKNFKRNVSVENFFKELFPVKKWPMLKNYSDYFKQFPVKTINLVKSYLSNKNWSQEFMVSLPPNHLKNFMPYGNMAKWPLQCVCKLFFNP